MKNNKKTKTIVLIFSTLNDQQQVYLRGHIKDHENKFERFYGSRRVKRLEERFDQLESTINLKRGFGKK